MRASRSFGTALTTARARSFQSCAINSFSLAVLNTRGQNSGVPGRLLRTRCRVEFSPAPPNWSSVSTASTYETLSADDSFSSRPSNHSYRNQIRRVYRPVGVCRTSSAISSSFTARKSRFRAARSNPSFLRAKVRCPSRDVWGAWRGV